MNSHHLLCALSSGASVQQESTDHLEAVSLTKEEPIMASRPISRWRISLRRRRRRRRCLMRRTLYANFFSTDERR